jgi:hypothetical protein
VPHDPPRIALHGPVEIRPTAAYRRKLVAAALARLALGALLLLAFCWTLVR